MIDFFNSALMNSRRVFEGFLGSEDRKVIKVRRGLLVLRVLQAEPLEKEVQRVLLDRQVSLANLEYLEYLDELENWEKVANLERRYGQGGVLKALINSSLSRNLYISV